MSVYKGALAVGSSISLKETLTEIDARRYASISGDSNPLHIDELVAKNSQFGGRIVHGNLIISLFTGMIATSFPGPGSILISQDIFFKLPVFLESEFELRLTVIKYIERARIYYLLAECRTNEIVCITGRFKVHHTQMADAND